MLNRLYQAQYFSKIDPRLSYYQIRITPKNIHKMVFRTRYKHYGFLIVSFSLTNISIIFQTFMNSIFREKLNLYMLVYIDNILIYN
jgi:hypothetical protein